MSVKDNVQLNLLPAKDELSRTENFDLFYGPGF